MNAQHTADSLSAPHQSGFNTGELAIGVIVGRTAEYFNFFVYAIASVLVFPKIVFPDHDPLTATMYSFGIFALAFVARPFGTLVFMAVDRIHGRTVKLVIAMLLLGTSTVAIAFLPGYKEIGVYAAVLLAIARCGQGIAWGGAWDGLPSLLNMNVPDNRRGWYAMIPQLGAMLGLALASGLFAYFVSRLSAADFLHWGWRYPFFVAFAINLVALFARVTIVSTPECKDLFKRRELQPEHVRKTIKAEGGNILIGSFAPLASFALFHMVTVFPLSWIFLFTGESPTRFLLIEMVGAGVGALCVIGSGLVADWVGRRMLLGVSAAAIAIFSGFAPQFLNLGGTGEMIYMILGFILLGLSFGQSSGVVAANFPKNYRYTASALTSDLAWLFGAGFAPLIALWLASKSGLLMTAMYLLSAALASGVALLANKTLATRRYQ